MGDAYDQWGAGLLLAMQVKLPAGMGMRLGTSERLEGYYHSGGEMGMLALGTDENRRDFLVHLFNELWLPPFHSLKFGVRYEWNHRNSTANESGLYNYEYDEHRCFFVIRAQQGVNPIAPRRVKNDKHVPLMYSGATEEGTGMAQTAAEVAQMLRQDEAAQAASSCIE